LRAVRVLIFHGYLLRGTGSNVYNASLAQALRGMGHEVHLLCQDSEAAELPWVDAVGRWEAGRLEVERVRDPEGEGSVTVYRPEIGGLLPVFVMDRYEGFEVKSFPELSEDELSRYLESNVGAVRDVVAAAGPPEAVLGNHLIMGPVILRRAGLSYALKVHGSDLSYTVRPHPDRFVPYAREAVDGAAGLLVGSSHTAADLFSTLEEPDLRERTRLGPPGVDVHRFRIREEGEALSELAKLADRLEAEPPDPEHADDSFGRDGPAIAAALRGWAEGSPRALFVGKLLVNKGVDLLAAAWPLVHQRRRAAGADAPRLLFIGFGAYLSGLETLVDALGRGDLDAAREVAARGRGFEGEGPAPLPILSAFLEAPPEGYAEAAKEAAGSILIGGRLEHDEVAEVMPAADAFAMPSTFPEAFGMVPAESAACGVPPVSADHSGMREVSRHLAEAVGPELAPLLSFEVGPGAVADLAERIDGWLSLPEGERRGVGRQLADRVHELWSWQGVARGVIMAARGELDKLPKVG
jgi:glycosyltransferase involved in cell wall biosynthesis